MNKQVLLLNLKEKKEENDFAHKGETGIAIKVINSVLLQKCHHIYLYLAFYISGMVASTGYTVFQLSK